MEIEFPRRYFFRLHTKAWKAVEVGRYWQNPVVEVVRFVPRPTKRWNLRLLRARFSRHGSSWVLTVTPWWV